MVPIQCYHIRVSIDSYPQTHRLTTIARGVPRVNKRIINFNLSSTVYMQCVRTAVVRCLNVSMLVIPLLLNCQLHLFHYLNKVCMQPLKSWINCTSTCVDLIYDQPAQPWSTHTNYITTSVFDIPDMYLYGVYQLLTPFHVVLV